MAENPISFQRGAFAVFYGDTDKEPKAKPRFIPFRFNPETLSRRLTIEQAQGQAQGQPPQTTARAGGGTASAGQGADADSGSLKEELSLLLRFDLADREETGARETGPNTPKEYLTYGVLPEISALEDLLHPSASAPDLPSDGKEPVRARARRPLVLLVWGEHRILPVKITGMTINETVFNGQLYPIRAEVEISLETLGERSALDNKRVASSLKFTADNRRTMARIFLETTSKQGTNFNPPPLPP